MQIVKHEICKIAKDVEINAYDMGKYQVSHFFHRLKKLNQRIKIKIGRSFRKYGLTTSSITYIQYLKPDNCI